MYVCCQHFSSSLLFSFHSTNTFQAGERTNTKTCFLSMKLVFIFCAFCGIFRSLLLLLWMRCHRKMNLCLPRRPSRSCLFLFLPRLASCFMQNWMLIIRSWIDVDTDHLSDARNWFDFRCKSFVDRFFTKSSWRDGAVGVYVCSAQNFYLFHRVDNKWVVEEWTSTQWFVVIEKIKTGALSVECLGNFHFKCVKTWRWLDVDKKRSETCPSRCWVTWTEINALTI